MAKVFGSDPKFKMPQIEKYALPEVERSKAVEKLRSLRKRIEIEAHLKEAVKAGEMTADTVTEAVNKLRSLPMGIASQFKAAVEAAQYEPRGKQGPIAWLRRKLVALGFEEQVIVLILDHVSAMFGLQGLRRQVRKAREERNAVHPTEPTIDAATDLLIKWHADPARRAQVVEKISKGQFDELAFRCYDEFTVWVDLMPDLGLGEPVVDRFMGGARRDVAVLQPNTEVTVFARWKDFLGKHVMHCHNVVHEDHAMMIRWEIMPKNEGFDQPRHVDEVSQVGERIDVERREHIESHPLGSAHQPDDH